MRSPTEREDEELLAALTRRLGERRSALQQSEQMLEEIRAVNERLESAEHLKGQFLSNIRNEINNPLTVLQGFAAAIVGSAHLSRERIVEIVAVMLRETSDLSFQMQNIFAAADFEAGKMEPSLARVQIAEVVAGVINDLKVLAEHKAIAIRSTMAAGLTVTTDPAKFGLLVTNLLRNAITFGRDSVQLDVAVAEGILTVDVRDDGPGLAVKESRRIFDRFVQSSGGSAKAHPGHGLGLSVAQACAELLGGSIEVIPSPGAGAHFRALLPLAEEESRPEESGASNELLFDAVETY